MKINIFTNKPCGSVMTAFDALYAFFQSRATVNYQSDIEISIGAQFSSNDFNILVNDMSKDLTEENLTQFNLVILSNGCESLETATPCMAELIALDKVYLLTNSYLTDLHPLKNKNIWFPPNFLSCRNYWTRCFYPQYFENEKNKKIPRDNSIIAINGSNRSVRHYFFSLLQQQVPEVTIRSNISTTVHKLNDGLFESQADTEFRKFTNDLYRDQLIIMPDTYFDTSPEIGIDKKFGKVTPGYFILPEYFKHACVVFPESGWQNDQLCITEKALKCFFSGSLPFPIGGSNINLLYNQLGFATAWNLLPKDLQKFDSIIDHVERYQASVEAIQWLTANKEIFSSDQFESLTNQNKINFLTSTCESKTVLKFDEILKNLQSTLKSVNIDV